MENQRNSSQAVENSVGVAERAARAAADRLAHAP
jgi:hypothetical protein